MKHILIITPIFPPRTGGPATYTWNLVHRLKSSHQLTIICFGSNATQIAGIKIIAISPHQAAILRQLKLLINVLFYGLGSSTVYIQGPLVVGLASSIAARIFSKKILLKFVGDEVWESTRLKHRTTLTLDNFYQVPHPFLTRFQIILENISFSLAHSIIVPSSYLKSFLAHHFHINPTKIIVISNAVNIPAPPSTHKRKQLIYIGRLVPWKNIDQIITATNLARTHKLWDLLIVGEGPELAKLKKLVTKLKANSWVKFTGRQSISQTLTHLNRSQKILLFSDYEGLSHTLIEAMLTKTAIIASDIRPNHEVTHGFAQLVPNGNIQKLSQAINTPSSHISRAYSYALKHYSWSNHLTKLQQYF